MPFRYIPRLAASQLRRCSGTSSFPPSRPFHSSRALLQKHGVDDDRSHYDTLNVRPDASPAEIKKSFYTLSKAHHPDHHPSDPGASSRFMRISAAYSVLSSPDKRAAYDRDVIRLHHHRHASHHHRGSYSSTGPAGGRPATGLSRRRGTFAGPPPSFYRNGGWGAYGEKRAAAHEESTGGAASGGRRTSSEKTDGRGSATSGAGAGGGMGPGRGHRHHHHDRDDIPHFDRAAHQRTHTRLDRRRAAAAAAAEATSRAGFGNADAAADTSIMGNFMLVSAALVVTLLIPVVVFARWEREGLRDRNTSTNGKKAKT